jgi:hypothetical protein
MRNLIIIILLFVLTGCGTTTVFVNENYSWNNSNDRTFAILPIPLDSVIIGNKDDVVDDFEVDSNSAVLCIRDNMMRSLTQNQTSFIANIGINNKPIPNNLFDNARNRFGYYRYDQKIEDSEKSYMIKYRIPQLENLDSLDINPDIVLIINSVYFDRNLTFNVGLFFSILSGLSGSPTISVSHSEFLGCSFNFIIWDYKSNEMIKCGIVNLKEDISMAMTRNTWITIFNKILENVVADTPLARK